MTPFKSQTPDKNEGQFTTGHDVGSTPTLNMLEETKEIRFDKGEHHQSESIF